MANMSSGDPASAAIAAVPGSADDASRMARVAATSQGIQRQKGKFESFGDVLANVRPYNTSQEYDLPNSAFMIGQYLPQHRDMDRAIASYLAMPAGNQPGGPGEEGIDWGIKTQPTELLLRRAEMAYGEGQHRAFLDLAAQLIDPTDPRTQEQAFAMVPELRDVPRERDIKIQRLHLMLTAILRTGTITTLEELYFIFELLNPESQIPLMPTWMEIVASAYADSGVGTNNDNSDLTGEALLSSRGARSLFKSKQFVNGNKTPYNLFNPWSYTLAPEVGKEDPQMLIKYVILRRLFPACRKADVTDNVLKNFLDTLYSRNVDAVELIKQLREGPKINAGLSNKAGGVGTKFWDYMRDNRLKA